MTDFLTPAIGPSLVISWGFIREVNGKPAVVRTSRSPLGKIPDDAPQAVKDLAAQHWTPEVIEAAKAKVAGVRPKTA